MMQQCELLDLSDKLLGLYDDGQISPDAYHDAGIALMVSTVALQLARQQLIALGGDGSGGDKIQEAVIAQIDAALERK